MTLRYLKEPTICIGWLPKSRFTGMGLGEGTIGRTLVFDEFSVRPWFLVQSIISWISFGESQCPE